MRKILLASLLTVATLSVSAQLVVDNTLTVEEYVQNILLGQGVTVSNITFNGQPGSTVTVQVGSFNSENSNVGINTGMIIASGDVNVAVGPNQSGSNTLQVGPWPDGQGVSDPDLQLINPGFTLNDAAILEFDFVPNGDTLKFNYVFGSDEYPEFVNSSFNDVFGFFLSGPGLNGPYSNNGVNIALIPGGNQPVTIDNCNNGNDGINGPCVNCEYYNHNGIGWFDQMWPSPGMDSLTFYDNYYMGFDGFTDPLEAFSIVQCGETYHIKIAVADAGDQAYDSAVFLEEGSFASNSVVEVDLEITVGTTEGILYEECGEAILTFTRSAVSNINVEDLVVVTYGGAGINGVDYTLLPDSIIFPAGVSSVTFNIDAFDDGLAEGDELVEMDILNVAACNGSGIESYFSFTISEVTTLQAEGADLYLCYGDEIEIGPLVSGGYGHYVYDWNTGDSDSSLTVSPLVPTLYEVMVSDTCDMTTVTVEIFVNVTDPVSVNAGPDQIVNCTDITNLVAEINGGVPDFSYSWTNGNSNLGNGDNINFNTDVDAVITISVNDECGNVATDEVQFTVVNPPIFINLPDYVYASCISNSIIAADVSGGSGDLEFEWTVNNQGNAISDETEVEYNAEENTWLFLEVSDGCGTIQNDSIFIDTSTNPPLVDAGDDINASCIDVNTLFAQVSGGQPGFTYEWYADGDLIGTGNVINYQTNESMTVQVVVTDVCGFVGQDEVDINIPNNPLFLEVSPDTAICLGSTIALYANAWGGEEGFTYLWPDFDVEHPWLQDTPQGPEEYLVIATDICGRSRSATINVDVQFVNAHIDLEYLTENLVQFSGSTFPDSCETCTYWWEFGDGASSDILEPQHEYSGLQEYTASFEVENEIGCRSIAYEIINPPVHLYIPTAFTPDGDGKNDVFFAVGSGITEFEMWIFNRWGELVFYSNDINVPWVGGMNGNDYFVQDGIYNWTVKYKGVNLEEFRRVGHVLIMR